MGISALLAAQILDASATGRSVLTGADASAIRTTLGLGTLATQSPTGTPSASTFLRGDFSWQTIDLSGYVPYSGATGAVNLGANAFTASQATLSAGTLNGTVLDIAQTWGGTGTYTGIKYNVTDSGPANAASLLLDLQVGGSSRFRVRKDSALYVDQIGDVASDSFSLNQLVFRNAKAWNAITDTQSRGVAFGFWDGYPCIRTSSFYTHYFDLAGSSVLGTTYLGFGANRAAIDIKIYRDAADTLAQRNSTNAQRLNLYGTYTDASNYRRLFLSSTTAGAFTIGVEGAGTGASGNTLTLGNPVSVTGGTITASTPALNVTQTWNNAATTFTGILANVTDTASNAASLLMDLQVGGSSKFSVDKSGRLLFPQTILNGKVILYTTNDYTSGFYGFGINASTLRFQIPDSSANFTFFSGTSEIYKLSGSKSFTINNTYTDSSNYERAKIEWSSNVLRIGTEKAGTGSARALELQTDGTTRLTIASTGAVTFSGNVSMPASSQLSWGAFTILQAFLGHTYLDSPTSGEIYLRPGGGTIRLTANSTGVAITGQLSVSAINLVTDTTTGTKIGTATTQKLGFYNSTPVVQPTAVADATDAASVITQLNALLSRMRDLGLIAT